MESLLLLKEAQHNTRYFCVVHVSRSRICKACQLLWEKERSEGEFMHRCVHSNGFITLLLPGKSQRSYKFLWFQSSRGKNKIKNKRHLSEQASTYLQAWILAQWRRHITTIRSHPTRTADEGILDCVKDRQGLSYTLWAFKLLKALYKFLWHQELHKENISCSIWT